MLVMIRGSVTVETLTVNASTPQVLEKQHGSATHRRGKEDYQGRYGITRTLTIGAEREIIQGNKSKKGKGRKEGRKKADGEGRERCQRSEQGWAWPSHHSERQIVPSWHCAHPGRCGTDAVSNSAVFVSNRPRIGPVNLPHTCSEITVNIEGLTSRPLITTGGGFAKKDSKKKKKKILSRKRWGFSPLSQKIHEMKGWRIYYSNKRHYVGDVVEQRGGDLRGRRRCRKVELVEVTNILSWQSRTQS
jgi:hypothetical protein